MKRLFLTMAMFAGNSFAATSEAAAADLQQTAAAACTVTENASLADVWTYVGFLTGTGTVSLSCPVDVNLASFNQLEVSYRDSDGTGNAAKVDVTLWKVPKTNVTAATSQLLFQSSLYSTTVWNDKFQSLSSTITFDHDNYYYFMMIGLGRSSTSAVPQIGHVKLCTHAFSC